MIKKIFLILTAYMICGYTSVNAQFVNLSGNNPDIREYVESNEDNWNKSIMYVFYSNALCPLCSRAMGMIYNIYEQYYLNEFSLFEINYEDNDEFDMRISYELNQPLSIVLVRIQDGESRGYYKIDNPQYFVNDPVFFNERLISQINNFLNM